jgi:probable F420-dependent oxidoreductase
VWILDANYHEDVLKISLFCRPHQLPGGDVASFATAAQLADEAGLYMIHFGEHLLTGGHTSKYPFGEWTHGPQTPWLDPLVALATAASVTSNIQLSTGILLAPLRSGPMLAKQLATLDVLSGGRLQPGLGVGWQREEFDASGIPWSSRYSLLDENVRMCRTLWGEQPATITIPSGPTERVTALPAPIQEHMPLLLGLAPTSRNIQRIVEYGDGWCPVRLTPDQLADGVRRIRSAFAVAGRDPDSLIVRAQAPLSLTEDGRINVPATLSVSAAYEAAGATILAVGPTVGCKLMDDVKVLVEELAAASA